MSSLLTMNLIQVLCSKSTVNYQLKTLQIVKFVTFLSQNDNMLFICVPSDASSLPLLAGYLLLGIVFYLWETMKMWARSIQPKFRPVRQGKVVYFKRWTSFFSKLFRLDRTDPLSFGPKFPEILVEWIAPLVEFHLVQTLRVTSLLRRG